MFVPSFKILAAVVPQKSLTEKKFMHRFTDKHCYGKEKKQLYILYTLYAGDITKIFIWSPLLPTALFSGLMFSYCLHTSNQPYMSCSMRKHTFRQCRPSKHGKDSYLLVNPQSLVSIHCLLKKHWVLSYPNSTQERP